MKVDDNWRRPWRKRLPAKWMSSPPPPERLREVNMVDLPQKKVGVIACSGEELAEGTVTRLAALKVLEQLRPTDTVTICLPLFLAGGEGDRAFARFYPTIAIDGCDKRCAATATELYSGKPAKSVIVTNLLHKRALGTARHLTETGHDVVELIAEYVADLVDELLDKKWDRRAGEFIGEETTEKTAASTSATCSCGSGLPVQQVDLDGQTITLVALPAILQQLRAAGTAPGVEAARGLLKMVKI